MQKMWFLHSNPQKMRPTTFQYQPSKANSTKDRRLYEEKILEIVLLKQRLKKSFVLNFNYFQVLQI